MHCSSFSGQLTFPLHTLQSLTTDTHPNHPNHSLLTPHLPHLLHLPPKYVPQLPSKFIYWVKYYCIKFTTSPLKTSTPITTTGPIPVSLSLHHLNIRLSNVGLILPLFIGPGQWDLFSISLSLSLSLSLSISLSPPPHTHTHAHSHTHTLTHSIIREWTRTEWSDTH